MTSAQQKPDQPKAAEQPQAQPQPQKRAATPEVFGDGSTKEQQKKLIQQAEEANAAVKKYADAERDARSS